MSNANTSQYSESFHSPDADVIFRSCDGVLFGIHRINLQTNTEGFPPSEIENTGEIVPLSESSSTLELLFQYIYPRRQPALDGIAFADLAALAEAAEKYQVFSAMNICSIRMKDVLPKHAPEILAYAAQHDYPALIYAAAPLTFDVPLSSVVAALPRTLILPWVNTFSKFFLNVSAYLLLTSAFSSPAPQIRYIDAWNQVLHDAIAVRQRFHYSNQQGLGVPCRFWKTERPSIAQRFGHSLNSLRRLDVIFAPNREMKQYPCCEAAKGAWRKEIEDAMAEIPVFRSFL